MTSEQGQTLPITETLNASLRFAGTNALFLAGTLFGGFMLTTLLLTLFSLAFGQALLASEVLAQLLGGLVIFLSNGLVMTLVAVQSLRGDWRYLLRDGSGPREAGTVVGVWILGNIVTFLACMPLTAIGVAFGGPGVAVPLVVLVSVFLQIRFFLAIPSSLALGTITLRRSWDMTRPIPWQVGGLFLLSTILSFILSTFLAFPFMVLEQIPVGVLENMGSLGSSRQLFLGFAISSSLNIIIATHAFRWLDYYGSEPLLDYGD